MYHDPNNIKEETKDVTNMNHRKDTDETKAAQPKDWKRCETQKKKQSAEKHQYVADKLISGLQDGQMNMKYYLNAFTHTENIYDNEDEKDLENNSDALPPLVYTSASEDEDKYVREPKRPPRHCQKDTNIAKSMDSKGGYRKCGLKDPNTYLPKGRRAVTHYAGKKQSTFESGDDAGENTPNKAKYVCVNN